MKRRIKKKKSAEKIRNENVFLKQKCLDMTHREAAKNAQFDEFYTLAYGIIGAVLLATGNESVEINKSDIDVVLKRHRVIIEDAGGTFKIAAREVDDEAE